MEYSLKKGSKININGIIKDYLHLIGLLKLFKGKIIIEINENNYLDTKRIKKGSYVISENGNHEYTAFKIKKVKKIKIFSEYEFLVLEFDETTRIKSDDIIDIKEDFIGTSTYDIKEEKKIPEETERIYLLDIDFFRNLKFLKVSYEL